MYSTPSNMRVNLSHKDRPYHHTNMNRIFSWTTEKSKTKLKKEKISKTEKSTNYYECILIENITDTSHEVCIV